MFWLHEKLWKQDGVDCDRIISEDNAEEFESWRIELVHIKDTEIPSNNFIFALHKFTCMFLQTRHLKAYAWLHTSVRQVQMKIKVYILLLAKKKWQLKQRSN